MAVSEQMMQDAAERYIARTQPREETIRKIATRPLIEVDTPERVQKRLRRLARAEIVQRPPIGTLVAAAVVGGPPAAAGRELSSLVLERVIGKSDLLGVGFLELGIKAARTVGRVIIRDAVGHVDGYGTGFLVSPSLLLTNNHVLPDLRTTRASSVEFNYQDGVDGRILGTVLFDLDPTSFFVTSIPLDFTIVGVTSSATDGTALRSFGWNRLIEDEGKILLGECVTVIQHPNGEPKQIALRENQLVDLLDDFLHYETDTDRGSSGSPVYNDEWEVVALHHQGVPRLDGQKRVLAKDGTVWTPSKGDDQVDWVANEGVRVSKIVRQLKTEAFSAEQRRLLDQLIDELPTEGHAIAAGPIITAMPRMDAAGVAEWTIPITVRIEVGRGNTAGAPPAAAPAKVSSNGHVRDSSAVEPAPSEAQRREALQLLEAGRRRKYYDAAKDGVDRDAYYANNDPAVADNQLFTDLSALVSASHAQELPYRPALHVYTWVDLHADGKIRSIYSGAAYDPEDFINEDFRTEAVRFTRLQERMSVGAGRSMDEELSLLEASLPYNCEHVVPQSWFDKRQPMRGDLHHLFACESHCNSFRGNTPYFEFRDQNELAAVDGLEVERTDCGERVGLKFEPVDGKGAVARATLYFLLRYPGEINRASKEYTKDRLAMLLEWHQTHEVTEYERHRNAAVFEKQGNRNPLIDFPEWAARIDFNRGLG